VTLADGSVVQGAGTDTAQGLSLTGVDFALALASDRSDASRRWVSLEAQAESAALTGVGGLTLSAADIGLRINQAERAADAVMDTVVAPIEVPTGTGTSATLSLDGSQGELLAASATVDLDAFGFLGLSGGLAFERSSAEVMLAGASTATAVDVLKIGGTGLGAFAGLNGGSADRTGLALSGVELGLVMLRESGVVTPREWFSLEARAAGAAFEGMDGLTVAASDAVVQINRKATDDSVVDYADGATSMAVATSRSTSLSLAMDGADGDHLRVSAHLTVDLFGFVQVEGDFALDRRDASLTLDDGSTVAVNLLTVGARGVQGFAGMGGGTDDAVGLALSDLDLALVFAAEDVQSGTPRQWTSLQGSAGAAALQGVDGVTLRGSDLSLQVNQAAADGHVVDYSAATLDVSAGAGDPITLDMDGALGELLRASGSMSLGVMEFFQASGDFALERSRATVHTADKAGTLADESGEVEVDLLTLGASGVSAFAGVGAGTDDAVGLSLDEAAFALAIAQERVQTGTPRQWTALKAQAGAAGMVGIDGLTLSGTTMSAAVNVGDVDGVVLDFADAYALDVATGPASTLSIDLSGADGETLAASGQVSVDLFGFASFDGALAVQARDGEVRLQGATVDTAVRLLTVGIDGAEGFVGLNGGSVDAVGLGFSGASVGLVVASDLADPARQWIAAQAEVASAAFTASTA
jgi:hypothetical protein